jgi:hypothetical protein
VGRSGKNRRAAPRQAGSRSFGIHFRSQNLTPRTVVRQRVLERASVAGGWGVDTVQRGACRSAIPPPPSRSTVVGRIRGRIPRLPASRLSRHHLKDDRHRGSWSHAASRGNRGELTTRDTVSGHTGLAPRATLSWRCRERHPDGSAAEGHEKFFRSPWGFRSGFATCHPASPDARSGEPSPRGTAAGTRTPFSRPASRLGRRRICRRCNRIGEEPEIKGRSDG